jgi:hypothetical protein
MCHRCGSALFPPEPLPITLLRYRLRLYRWLHKLIERLTRALEKLVPGSRE